MCGIAGLIRLNQDLSGEELKALVTAMTDEIRHRGPDDEGCWVDQEQSLALGHRRLSIIDLSEHGHQPMMSACQRFVLVFNGEIYNHNLLRKKLEEAGIAPVWNGHSDTEVMLCCFAHWGVEETLKQMNGMFALALWDRKTKTLYLARDRMGEKPLYYANMQGEFGFASELKALKRMPSFKKTINRQVLALYCRLGYVPGSHCIYENVAKVLPGQYLEIRLEGGQPQITTNTYWSFNAVVEAGLNNPIQCEASAKKQLDILLREATALRMESDVPLGVFLSGGVDSSLIAALAQAESDKCISTYSIGFEEQAYDEAGFAREVASHIGSRHTEMYVGAQDALDVIPTLPAMYDEPFADPSQIPTHLVAKMARQHITVALSGDAGDELFGGYKRYFWARKMWRGIDAIPKPFRHLISSGLDTISPDQWDHLLKLTSPVLGRKLSTAVSGDRIHKMAPLFRSDTPESMYHELISIWPSTGELCKGQIEASSDYSRNEGGVEVDNFFHKMMYLDSLCYLPDDILTKVDRATMSVSLEGRIPFLDHRVVEFAWTLPLEMKVKGNEGKYILKELLDQYVPRKLIERPKAGFGVPLDVWLRGPLKDWAADLLSPENIESDGFFDNQVIQQTWQEFQSGARNWQQRLWHILMFMAWYREQ
jgi:asparagine synthase (glutamine-hydrolysing)